MTQLIIEAGELLATEHPRRRRALLLPYGETGNTNLGRLTVDKGTITIPTDPAVVTLNEDHARQRPIGRAVQLEDTERGIYAEFEYATTADADAAMANPDKRCVSAEVTDLVIRAGRTIAGRLYGAAQCERGAFPSATLLASDTSTAPTTTEGTTMTEEEKAAAEKAAAEKAAAEAAAAEKAAAEQAAQDGAAEGADDAFAKSVAQHLAASLPASLVPQGRITTEPAVRIDEPSDLYAALAKAYTTGDHDLMAALNDVKISGSGTVGAQINQPQWLGKLWQGLEYVRRFIPLVTQGPPLNSLEVVGWKWTTKPTMAKWAGNKANVPSNSPAATRVPHTAQRFAGGHDIAREYRDFSNPEFWEEYFKAMRESYAQESDVYALETAVAEATAVTPGTNPAPTEVSDGLVAIVDAALKVNRKAAPTFAVLAEDIWRDLVLTPHEHVLEYLSASLSLDEGSLAGFKLQPTPYRPDETPVLTDGQVLVGAKPAVQVRELGNPPIRVEGLDMVRGGIDTGLFGYALARVEEPLALALVTPEPTP